MKINEQQILDNLGIESLNTMQKSALKNITKENDVFLLSPTGSGKTLAFLLPLPGMLKPEINAVQCLILAPSRELALQIEQVWKKMSTGFKVNACYGGHDMSTEINNLSNPPAVLIGTPGRIADHMTRRTFSLNSLQILILDEFDKSLALGFHEQMSFIIGNLRKLRKRVLVSATSGIQIPEFAGIKEPVVLDFIPKEETETALLTQLVVSEEKDKINALFHLICNLNSENALIFCNHRDAVERTSQLLNEKGIFSSFYHGGMEQDDRERALIKFRNGTVRYLITTDLAARGLDIPEMKYVIHYHLPAHEHEFIHRNGRTARMKASGTAYVLLHHEEKVPHYLPEDLEEFKVNKNRPVPKHPEFQTIYVSGGRKDKVSKGDIVGLFSQKGKLEKEDIGLIEVQDFISFVAVREAKVAALLAGIKNEKMKGKKFKIEVAR